MLLRAAPRGRVAHFGVEGSERGASGKVVVVWAIEPEKNVKSTKEPAEFKLPPLIDEAWARLRNRGGAHSDLRTVLSFLAKLWVFDSSDPRGFDEWLSNLGVSRRTAPSAILAEYREKVRARTERESYINAGGGEGHSDSHEACRRNRGNRFRSSQRAARH
jgi:hypothetical protein